MPNTDQVFTILRKAKKLAQQYRQLTGKPLSVTGEVAEYEAARILDLELTAARQTGYDAVEQRKGKKKYLQIKGRCVLDGGKSQRLGSIDIEKKWDAVLMVLLNKNLEAIEIREAPRKKVIEAILKPGSRARNERGALSVSKFRSISKPRWRLDGL
jgi:hypothetical protein